MEENVSAVGEVFGQYRSRKAVKLGVFRFLLPPNNTIGTCSKVSRTTLFAQRQKWGFT
jgi:hypothetical protein